MGQKNSFDSIKCKSKSIILSLFLVISPLGRRKFEIGWFKNLGFVCPARHRESFSSWSRIGTSFFAPTKNQLARAASKWHFSKRFFAGCEHPKQGIYLTYELKDDIPYFTWFHTTFVDSQRVTLEKSGKNLFEKGQLIFRQSKKWCTISRSGWKTLPVTSWTGESQIFESP